MSQESPVADDLPPTLTIELDPPIEVKGGATYSELNLSEPLSGQVLNAEKHLKGNFGAAELRLYALTLVSQNSGVPMNVLRDYCPIGALNKAANYLQRFIEAGQDTGAS
ncbi:phage tail assembly protein [Acetobacter orientalis]|uniref:phage tail assembly protein n=1 Tax=Acetobacter orientalis TaxID=146474 RepID=UPI0039E91CC2